MEAQIKLGRLFGVKIGLHYSWLIIAFLITVSLAGHFRTTNAQWGSTVIWITAISTGVLFFAAIIAHELSHAIVAKARGLPVKSITLFALGGVAQIEKEAADAKTEFWMGIAGPITSVVIGFILLGIALALGWSPTSNTPMSTPHSPLLAMLVWLGYINISLAIFNMIPGFPLDGGRVLRAILWWITGKVDRSTKIAARVGQFVAFGFIAIGVIRFFGGSGFGGLWIAFIGWFLLDAARASYMQVGITESLRGLLVRDVMESGCPEVNGNMNLQTLVDDYVLRTGQRCFMVIQDNSFTGMITPHEIKNVPRINWRNTTVENVMRPLEQLRIISPDSSVIEALEVMGHGNVNQLPVVSDSRLKGVISRSHILELLRTRAELNM